MNWQYSIACFFNSLRNIGAVKPTRAYLILGQSNACNVTVGSATLCSARGVYQLDGSVVRVACDPLRAVEGTGTSFIIRLGDLIAKRSGPVVMASVAVGGSSIKDWQDTLYTRAQAAQNQLARMSIPIAGILWMQGETDALNNTAYTDYKAGLEDLASRFPFYFYVPEESFANGRTHTAISGAQKDATAPNIRNGPNLDALGNQYRMDGTHFNEAGCAQAAALWNLVL